jgi:hypothetical protein
MPGYVKLYLRTFQRLLVLKFPGGEDRIFKLRLPASPLERKYHPGPVGKSRILSRKAASNLLVSGVARSTRFAPE